ncbi:MAG: uracil-DNA glycosylase [Butyricicoccus sp.]
MYPAAENIFNALRYTPYSKVKAVILGQDPYHGPGQAHGLCFSVQPGVQPPPSLQNIFKELQSDLGIVPPKDGTLTKWAERGVLMLNTTLTVRRGQANSHKNLGWTTFTDHIIEKLNEHEQPIVFLLWGGNARSRRNSSLHRSTLCSKACIPLLCRRTMAFSAASTSPNAMRFSKRTASTPSTGISIIKS